MSEHTPEPWFYDLEDGSDLRIYSETNANIVYGCGCCGSPNCDDADARRIVASVNACAGISTARLEGGTAPVICHIAELEQQRDKLLAALESAVEAVGDHWISDGLREVIAEVKGLK